MTSQCPILINGTVPPYKVLSLDIVWCCTMAYFHIWLYYHTVSQGGVHCLTVICFMKVSHFLCCLLNVLIWSTSGIEIFDSVNFSTDT